MLPQERPAHPPGPEVAMHAHGISCLPLLPCPARLMPAGQGSQTEDWLPPRTQPASLTCVVMGVRSWAEPALDYIELYYKALKV